MGPLLVIRDREDSSGLPKYLELMHASEALVRSMFQH